MNTIDKNYFLDRLAAGEDIDAIGQEMAKAMNEALEAHRAAEEAKKAAAAQAENEATKKDIVQEMVELIQEYAILEGMDPSDVTLSSEEIENICAAFSSMFATMRQLKSLATKVEAKRPSHQSDDDILSEFVKIFS